jgi:hypothetical protein
MLSHIYSLTFWLHSDALFCLLSTAAVLISFQINEGKAHIWRTIVLILLCAGAVTVRWAGLLTWLVVAAVLLNGELWPKMNRRFIIALITGCMTFGTFVSVRAALSVPPELERKIRDAGGSEGGDLGQASNTAGIDPTATRYRIFNPASGGVFGYVARVLRWGNWFGYLLWQPLRLGASNAAVGAVALLVGWLSLLSVVVLAWRAIPGRQWIWLAILCYALMLALNWPHPNARYLVPIAPLIVLAVFKGFDVIRELAIASPAYGRTLNVLLGYFVASILICNGALYAVDVAVARSDDFYANYDAGMDIDLISTAVALRERGVGDQQIGVSEQYVNLGRLRKSLLAIRATYMLTDRSVVPVPKKYLRLGDPRRNPRFLEWARALGIKYVLYQPDVSPWRLFHFRVGWLQELMTGEPAIDTGAGWRLYEIPDQGEEAIRVSVRQVKDWPTRVPGM